MLFCVALSSVGGFAAQDRTVYRRATVLEDRLGKTGVGVVYSVPLTVLADCEADRRGCPEVLDYEAVVRLDFVSERRELSGETLYRSEEGRGTILAAFALPPDELEEVAAQLRDRLRRLSAQAFVEPFAGWAPMVPPFDASLAAAPERPTWVCFVSDEATVVQRVTRFVSEDGDVGTGVGTYAEPPTAMCEEMERATRDRYPEFFETPPAPQRLLETTVLQAEAVRIDRDVDALLPLPEGVRVIRQRAPAGALHGRASGGRDGDRAYAVRVARGWFQQAWAAPLELPTGALDRDAWLHRWSVSTVERTFGAQPSERPLERAEFHVAYLATLPPETVEGEASGAISSEPPQEPPRTNPSAAEEPARIDRASYLQAALDRLDVHHGPPLPLLEEWAALPDAGLESDGWIAVVCHADGTATYSLPPTEAAHRVLNADLFCAAVEARVER